MMLAGVIVRVPLTYTVRLACQTPIIKHSDVHLMSQSNRKSRKAGPEPTGGAPPSSAAAATSEQKRAEPEAPGLDAQLLTAAAADNLPLVKSLIARGAHMDAVVPCQRSKGAKPERSSPLREAAGYDCISVLKYLLSLGADLNLRCDKNGTALMYAAAYDCSHAVQELVKAGAAVDAVDADGATALHHACMYGSVASLQILLQAPGINVNTPDSKGRTPLHVAAGTGSGQCISALLAKGALTHMYDYNARTAWEAAYHLYRQRTGHGSRGAGSSGGQSQQPQPLAQLRRNVATLLTGAVDVLAAFENITEGDVRDEIVQVLGTRKLLDMLVKWDDPDQLDTKNMVLLSVSVSLKKHHQALALSSAEFQQLLEQVMSSGSNPVCQSWSSLLLQPQNVACTGQAQLDAIAHCLRKAGRMTLFFHEPNGSYSMDFLHFFTETYVKLYLMCAQRGPVANPVAAAAAAPTPAVATTVAQGSDSKTALTAVTPAVTAAAGATPEPVLPLDHRRCAHAMDSVWPLLHLSLLDIDEHIQEGERFVIVVHAYFMWTQVMSCAAQHTAFGLNAVALADTESTSSSSLTSLIAQPCRCASQPSLEVKLYHPEPPPVPALASLSSPSAAGAALDITGGADSSAAGHSAARPAGRNQSRLQAAAHSRGAAAVAEASGLSDYDRSVFMGYMMDQGPLPEHVIEYLQAGGDMELARIFREDDAAARPFRRTARRDLSRHNASRHHHMVPPAYYMPPAPSDHAEYYLSDESLDAASRAEALLDAMTAPGGARSGRRNPPPFGGAGAGAGAGFDLHDHVWRPESAPVADWPEPFQGLFPSPDDVSAGSPRAGIDQSRRAGSGRRSGRGRSGAGRGRAGGAAVAAAGVERADGAKASIGSLMNHYLYEAPVNQCIVDFHKRHWDAITQIINDDPVFFQKYLYFVVRIPGALDLHAKVMFVYSAVERRDRGHPLKVRPRVCSIGHHVEAMYYSLSLSFHSCLPLRRDGTCAVFLCDDCASQLKINRAQLTAKAEGHSGGRTGRAHQTGAGTSAEAVPPPPTQHTERKEQESKTPLSTGPGPAAAAAAQSDDKDALVYRRVQLDLLNQLMRPVRASPDVSILQLEVEFVGEMAKGDGPTREFFDMIHQVLFSPHSEFFTVTPDGRHWHPRAPSPALREQLGGRDVNSYFELIGRLLALSVVARIPLGVRLSHPLLRMLLGRAPRWTDLQGFDEPLNHSLSQLLMNPVDAAAGLTFTYTTRDPATGKMVDKPLSRFAVTPATASSKGAAAARAAADDAPPVTDENKLQYVTLLAHARVTEGVEQQLLALQKGFQSYLRSEDTVAFRWVCNSCAASVRCA